MQRWSVAFLVVNLCPCHRSSRLRRRAWHRPPFAKPNPRALLLARALYVEEADPCAILLQDVLHSTLNRQRLRPGQVDPPTLQLAAVKNGKGPQPARFWLTRLPSPLQHANCTQFRRILILLRNLARVLSKRGQRCEQPGRGQRSENPSPLR